MVKPSLMEENTMLENLFNYQTYPWGDIIVNLVAMACWAGAYIILIVQGFKTKTIGIPVVGVIGNISWELLFSTVFSDILDYGWVVTYGVKIWLIFDFLILYLVIRYGMKQFKSPMLAKQYYPIIAFFAITWLAGIYIFVQSGYDNSLGGHSAIILNFTESVLFLLYIMQHTKDVNHLSNWVAFLKWIGTACYVATTIIWFKYHPTDKFVWVFGALTFLVDAYYFFLLYKLKKQAALKPA